MKKIFTLPIMFLLSACILQAQTKIVGEKGQETIVGEKGRDQAIAASNADIEAAFAKYNQQRQEMEKSLADLRLKIEKGIKLSEKYKRFRSPKQGMVLRSSWRAALKQWEEAKKKINTVNAGVVAPDMIR